MINYLKIITIQYTAYHLLLKYKDQTKYSLYQMTILQNNLRLVDGLF